MAEQIATTAVHKKTKKMYHVLGRDSIGTLVKLKGQDGITIVSNIGYYDFYTYDGRKLEVEAE